jgi:hypothetical protein
LPLVKPVTETGLADPLLVTVVAPVALQLAV